MFISIKDVLDVFMPVFKVFSDLWKFFQTGVYTAYMDVVESVPILGEWWDFVGQILENNTGIDEWLNQFTILEFTIGGGIFITIVITMIGWITDKVGL